MGCLVEYFFAEEVAMTPDGATLLEILRHDLPNERITVDLAGVIDNSDYIRRGDISFPPRIVVEYMDLRKAKKKLLSGLYQRNKK